MDKDVIKLLKEMRPILFWIELVHFLLAKVDQLIRDYKKY